MAQIKLLKGQSKNLANKAIVAGQLLYTTDTKHIYFDADDTTRLRLYESEINDIADLKLKVGSVSVANAIKTAIDELKKEIVLSVGAKNASIGIDQTDKTKPIFQVNISNTADNALTLESDGLSVIIPEETDYSVEMITDTTDDTVAKQYVFKQLGNTIGIINVPKDMVVQSGSVVNQDADGNTGTFLKLVLANATNDEIYIDASKFITYITTNSTTADDVILTIDEQHQISAKLNKTVKDKLSLAESALQASDIEPAEEVEGQYISAVSVDNATNKITFTKADLPDINGLYWGDFDPEEEDNGEEITE